MKLLIFAEISARMAARNMKTKDLAEKTGIKERSLNNKLAQRTEFTLPEMYKVQEVLGGTLDLLFRRVDV